MIILLRVRNAEAHDYLVEEGLLFGLLPGLPCKIGSGMEHQFILAAFKRRAVQQRLVTAAVAVGGSGQ